MKISKYNYVVSCKGFCLIYNGLKSTCVIMSSDEYDDFTHFRFNATRSAELLRLGFYVNNGYNELDEILYNVRKADATDRQHFYRIYTTTACNAHCPYCYEKDLPISTLSIDIAEAIVSVILSSVSPGDKLGIEWFGGEPLLNSEIITYISERLIEYCESNNIVYWSRIITNGYLLSDEIIEKMVSAWYVKNIQVTLDGLKDTYERTKSFCESNSYERIMANIESVLIAGVGVTIRINYDNDNLEEVLQLIRFLSRAFGKYNKFKVYCKHIMSDDTDNSATSSEETDIKVLNELIVNGLIKDILKTIPKRTNTCVAHMLNAFMVLPDGKIGKCSQAIAKGDLVGDIDSIMEAKLVRWCSPQLPPKCIMCEMLPLCQGGCLFERFSNKPYCFVSRKVLDYKLLCYLKDWVDASIT